MKQREQMHHWKTTAGRLGARLSELLLQLGRVWHRDTRAIDAKRAMAMPASVIEHRTSAQMLAERAQQEFQDTQRQALACLAISLAAASESAQAWHVRTRGVAVQDLQNEQMHGRYRIKDAFAPDMVNYLTDVAYQLGTKKLGNFGLDLLHGSEDTTSHPWPPVGVWELSTAILTGGPFCI